MTKKKINSCKILKVLTGLHLLMVRTCLSSLFTIVLHCCACNTTPKSSCTSKKKKGNLSYKKKLNLVRGETWMMIAQRLVSVSQQTGTGSTGSGSLLLDHYVIGWGQFALFLLACEAEREGERERPVCPLRETLKKPVLSTPPRTPHRHPRHTPLYKPESIQMATVIRHF